MGITNTNLNPFKILAYSVTVGALAGALEGFFFIRPNMGLDRIEISVVLLFGMFINALFCLALAVVMSRFARAYGLVVGVLFAVIGCEGFLWFFLLRLESPEWVYWLLSAFALIVSSVLGIAMDGLFKGKGLLLLWLIAPPLAWVTSSRTMVPLDQKEGDRHNLILLTIDGVEPNGFFSRKDFKTMPTLSTFADRSAFFERAYAPSPFEQAALYSLLTGRHPIESGVDEGYQQLPIAESHLAKALGVRGYQSAAFVGLRFSAAKMNLDDGFDRFDDIDPFRSFALMRVLERFRFSPASMRIRSASEVMGNAIEWVKNRPPGPFFLWVHLSDLNGPFSVEDAVLSDTPSLGLPLDWPSDAQRISSQTDLLDAYHKALKEVDAQIEHLFQTLQEQQIDDQALIVVAGSSGGYGPESQTPFGSPKDLSESTLHVPLMLYDSRLVKKGTISCQTSLDSIHTALLSLLKPSPDPKHRLEGTLRGGDCSNEALLAVGKMASTEGGRVFQQRIMAPEMTMLRQGDAVECLQRDNNGFLGNTVPCDSRLTLIWELTSIKLKGETLPTITPEQSRQMAEFGIE